MNFIKAVEVMKEGKKVRRKDKVWRKSFDYVMFINNESKFIPLNFYQNNKLCDGKLRVCDYKATDWEIVE